MEITKKIWGQYKVLEDFKNVKIKELIVEPKKSLSLQRHFKRSELWFVQSGVAKLYRGYSPDTLRLQYLSTFDSTIIETNEWHKLCNEGIDDLHIIEIQYGEECIEEDIERIV